MKNFIAISRSNIHVNGERYFIVNKARENKEHIVYYDTTFHQILHYCFGVIDCTRDLLGNDSMDPEVYFIAGNGMEQFLDNEQLVNLITEMEFLIRQQKIKEEKQS